LTPVSLIRLPLSARDFAGHAVVDGLVHDAVATQQAGVRHCAAAAQRGDSAGQVDLAAARERRGDVEDPESTDSQTCLSERLAIVPCPLMMPVELLSIAVPSTVPPAKIDRAGIREACAG